jgi:hypothetical protein
MSVSEGLVGTLVAKSEILDVVHSCGGCYPMGRQIGAESASKPQSAFRFQNAFIAKTRSKSKALSNSDFCKHSLVHLLNGPASYTPHPRDSFLKKTPYTATMISFMCSQKRNYAASVPIPHSSACERFIYSQDRSTYFPAAD